ncbi:hypothetical protein AGIG_G17907 [Arapaima gigas]
MRRAAKPLNSASQPYRQSHCLSLSSRADCRVSARVGACRRDRLGVARGVSVPTHPASKRQIAVGSDARTSSKWNSGPLRCRWPFYFRQTLCPTDPARREHSPGNSQIRQLLQ